MRVNKKEKNVDVVCNNILLDLVWQSNITQGWHPCRGRLGGSSGMNILRCAFLSHILIYYSPRASDCRRKWQPTPGFLRRIPCTEEPGGLQSMGSKRVGHN